MSTQKSNPMLVSDVMMSRNAFPVVGKQTILKEALDAMNVYKIGIVAIVGEDDALLGILTDGDLRRKLLKVQKPFAALLVDDALDHAITTPVTVTPESTISDAVSLIAAKRIWDLPVVDRNGKLVGLLHLLPAVEALLARSK